MSQSDYLKRKQIAQILRTDSGSGVDNHQPAVLSSQQILEYKQYQIINDINNDSINYNLITPANKKNIFDMERDVNGCPSFIVCNNTNNRPNRVLNNITSCAVQYLPLTWQDLKNKKNKNKICKCTLKRTHMNVNTCSCDITTAELEALQMPAPADTAPPPADPAPPPADPAPM